MTTSGRQSGGNSGGSIGASLPLVRVGDDRTGGRGDRPVPFRIADTALVMKALEPIWREKTETASRVRGRIERVLDWATAHGYRSPEVQNPARWRGHLENLLPPPAKVARPAAWPALPYPELPALMSRPSAPSP